MNRYYGFVGEKGAEDEDSYYTWHCFGGRYYCEEYTGQILISMRLLLLAFMLKKLC